MLLASGTDGKRYVIVITASDGIGNAATQAGMLDVRRRAAHGRIAVNVTVTPGIACMVAPRHHGIFFMLIVLEKGARLEEQST